MVTQTAHRIEMDRYGPPEVLEFRETNLLPLAPGEIRIRTIAAAVNRGDVEIRRGNWPVQQPEPFPYTPGLEVLGEVVEAAADITWPRPGERAITMMQHLGGIHGERPGGYGEYVAVPAAHVAVVPDDVDPYALAALGLAAVTALEGLRRLDLRPGQRVAVHGASGGVGSVALSLAKGFGAHVIAVLNRADPPKEDQVRSQGADEIAFLEQASLVERYGARTLDAVLEVLGQRTFSDSVAVLRHGGRLSLVGAVTGPDLQLVAWDLMQDLVLTGYSSENLTGDQLRADIDHLVGELRARRINAPPYQVVPLAQAAEAHRLMESSQVAGRLLLAP
jgi:NADPH2:quinone reductase